jgi:cytochrome c biogenesis protein CcdA
MSFLKRIFLLVSFFILSAFLLSSPAITKAQEAGKTEVAVFVRQGCAHCQKEETFLKKLSVENNSIAVRFYRLENQEDRKVWEKLTSKLQISKVTPITVVGNKYLIGYDNEKNTGVDIKNLILEMQKSKIITDLNQSLREAGEKRSTCLGDDSIPCSINPKTSYSVTLPILGKIDANKYPLFILSAILGLFDGFNPCAMWVLITFLIILIEVGNRKKMFIFAGIFILAEAIMYSLILTVWFKTWDFVKMDNIITPIVGLVAIVGGIFFLKEWRKKELECKVTDLKQRAKTREKIQQLVANKFTLLSFLGILGIAFSVNIIEFACSIGIPQAFTKIVEINQPHPLQVFLMIAIYIFFYMIDDLIVFGFALWGADRFGLTTKYSKLSNLIGGIVMLVLGIVLIFKPELLLF